MTRVKTTIEVNEKDLIVSPIVPKKKKFLAFNEAKLLKGLTAKTAHADELIDVHYYE
jgi:hypothetical protein